METPDQPTPETPPQKPSNLKWVLFLGAFLGAPALTVFLANQSKSAYGSNGIIGLLVVQPISSFYCAYVVTSARHTGFNRIVIALLFSIPVWIVETILAFAGCADFV